MIAFDYSYQNIPNTSIDERFKIKFKPVSRPLKTWKEELLLSAKTIVQSTNKPIYVTMSGGIDSEQVARILMELNIDFKVLTVRHKQNTNSYDIRYAIQFCNSHNIEQVFVELDTQYFFTQGIEKYIDQGFRSTNLYHYLQLFMIEKLEDLGGFGIGGAGEQVYFTNNGETFLKINPHYTLAMDFIKKNKLQHNFWLNLSSPEIYASYLKLDIVDFLLQQPEYFVDHHHASIEKIMIYHQHWPEMQKRNKYTGFESIELGLRQPKQNELIQRFPDLVDLYYPVSKMKQELSYE